MATTQSLDCAVCSDPIVPPIAALPCTHSFHVHCITSWIKTANVCPLCRERFNSYSVRGEDGSIQNIAVQDRDRRVFLGVEHTPDDDVTAKCFAE